jgi:hypothetical protein
MTSWSQHSPPQIQEIATHETDVKSFFLQAHSKQNAQQQCRSLINLYVENCPGKTHTVVMSLHTSNTIVQYKLYVGNLSATHH